MKLNILIATGIYPPKIGGPAQYVKNLKKEFEKMGHTVSVKTYKIENFLPAGIRHLFFFLKIIFPVIRNRAVFIFDTFSVGLPTVLACKIFGKKGIIRTGGDFLWEQYVERTKKKVLFKDFYQTETLNFSRKERIVFKLTKWTLKNASKIIFSTEWQRGIFIRAYGLREENTCIVENYYGPKELESNSESKTFIASARKLVWKNLDILQKAFSRVKIQHPKIALFTDNLPFSQFVDKIRNCYAVVVTSLGDISPNIILDAIRMNKPFICTKETGIFERVKNAGIFVDPLNENEIKEAILSLLTDRGYRAAKEKVESFDFIHTWEEIAEKFIEIYKSYGIPDYVAYIQKSAVDFRKKNPISKILYFIKAVFHSLITLRYFLCGITAAVTNIFSLYLLTDIGHIWYLYSSIIAFLISLIVSFILQKFVVFRDMGIDGVHYQFSKFSLALTLGIITNTFLVFVCVDILGIWYILAQIIAGFFVMIQNFILYKCVIFDKQSL